MRFFHSTVAAFTTTYLSEDGYLTLHTWAGYTVVTLAGLRLAWSVLDPP